MAGPSLRKVENQNRHQQQLDDKRGVRKRFGQPLARGRRDVGDGGRNLAVDAKIAAGRDHIHVRLDGASSRVCHWLMSSRRCVSSIATK
jgi:hypothetical protein